MASDMLHSLLVTVEIFPIHESVIALSAMMRPVGGMYLLMLRPLTCTTETILAVMTLVLARWQSLSILCGSHRIRGPRRHPSQCYRWMLGTHTQIRNHEGTSRRSATLWGREMSILVGARSHRCHCVVQASQNHRVVVAAALWSIGSDPLLRPGWLRMVARWYSGIQPRVRLQTSIARGSHLFKPQ